MGNKNQTATSSTTSSPAPQAEAIYNQILKQAQGVAATPYSPYTGEMVAPINAQQNQGIAGINQYAQYALPYIQNANTQLQAASQPITAAQIQQYQSPYTQSVVNATEAQFNNQNAQQQQSLLGNAIAQGALGGNRVGVAQANLAGQQQLAQAPVIANLYNQGYDTALNTALQEQQNQMNAAYGTANLGVTGQQAALSGAGSQLGAGTLQQQTQQALDQALYNQYLTQQAYPFQTTQWLAGIGTGVGSQLGGTSTGSATQPGPSGLSQGVGLATSALGFLGMFSDKRLKENIKAVGKLKDGQTIYRFNYKGDPTTHIGLLAQDVEKSHPEAVGVAGHYKTVDYDRATRDAAERAFGGGVANRAMGGSANYQLFGGGFGVPSTPYGSASSWVPSIGVTRGSGPPRASIPKIQQQPGVGDQLKGVGALGKNLQGFMNGFGGTPLDISGPGVQGFTPDPVGTIAPIGTPSLLPPLYRYGGGVAGYADGGAPATFDERFSGDADNIAGPSPWAAQLPIIAPDAAYLNGVAPLRSGSFPVQKSEGINFDERFGGKPLPPQSSDGPSLAAPDNSYLNGVAPLSYGNFAPHNAAAPRGVVSSEEGSLPITSLNPMAEGNFPYRPSEPVSLAPGDNAVPTPDINRGVGVIAQLETGGQKDPYGYVGVPTYDQAGNAHRPIGKYGIMDFNVPNWTSEVLGKPMSVAQFLRDSDAQDAVARAKFGQYVNKYGPEGAARAWLGGPGNVGNPNATDVLGTSTGAYGRRFMQAYNGDEGAERSGNGVIPTGAEPAQYRPATRGLYESGASPSQTNNGGMFDRNSELWPALIAAGFGMLASQSPFPGVAIGQGGLAGLSTFAQQREFEQQQAVKQRELELQAQRLQQAYQIARMPYERMTPYQREALQQREKIAKLPYTQMTAAQQVQTNIPRVVGQGIAGPVYGVPGPNGTWVDPLTRNPISPNELLSGLGGGAGSSGEIKPAQMDQWTKDYGAEGAKLLSSYPLMVRNNVLGLLNGNIDPARLSYRDRTTSMRLASAVDPNFNTFTAPMRAAAVKAFTTGTQGNQIRFFNNAVQHLDTLRELITGLGNGDIKGLNAIRNTFRSQFGSPMPDNFEAAKAIVGQEIVKAIVANGGGEREREEAAAQLSAAKSPQQLNGIIDTYTHLMGAQLRDLKVQYNAAGLKDFNKYLIPESQEELARVESHAAARRSGNIPQQFSSKDQEALDWANANPNDPRATKIKKHLGIH